MKPKMQIIEVISAMFCLSLWAIASYVHLFVKNEPVSIFTVIAALCIVASCCWVYRAYTAPLSRYI